MNAQHLYVTRYYLKIMKIVVNIDAQTIKHGTLYTKKIII